MNNEILRLYRKYINNQCSSEELDRVIELIGKGEHQIEWDFILDEEADKVVNSDLHEEMSPRRLNGLHTRIQRSVLERLNDVAALPVRTSYWPRIAAAAIFIIALGLGIYLNTDVVKNEATKIVKYENDIAPGGNKAILTLDNGRKIILTDLKNGEVVEQAGIKIVKTADGQLIYKISDSQRAGTNLKPSYNTIETPKGGQYQVQLPDGTKVWLNASSSLKFPSSFASLYERKVELSGEAYFEVAHNKAVPFRVETARQLVEVLGTHFNISAYNDDDVAKTTLLQGSVKVLHNLTQHSQLLKPGQQAALTTSEIKVDDIDTELAVAWKNDLFMFEHDDIQHIMKLVERWYDVEVHYIGEIPTDKFGGAVSKFNNVSEVLKTLELTGKVHFKIEGRRIIVTK